MNHVTQLISDGAPAACFAGEFKKRIARSYGHGLGLIQALDASLFNLLIYAPRHAEDKTPAAKTIANAARLSRGEVLLIMANPLLN